MDKVLPNLDELLDLAKACYDKYALDLSAVRFLETLVYLRRVFLEDAVMKRQLFPKFPAYKQHPVFQDPAWKVYAEEEAQRVEERARLYEVKRSNPVLAATLQKEMDRRMVIVDEKLAQLEELRKVASSLANSKEHTPEPEASVQEMLTFKDNDMKLLYAHWRKYHKFFMEHATSMPWAKAFAELNARKAQAVRFCKLKPWLHYMDGLVDMGYDMKDVMATRGRSLDCTLTAMDVDDDRPPLVTVTVIRAVVPTSSTCERSSPWRLSATKAVGTESKAISGESVSVVPPSLTTIRR
jgi:hypothetical protein